MTEFTGGPVDATVESSGHFIEEFKKAATGNNFAALKRYVDQKQGIGWGPCYGNPQLEYLSADKMIETLLNKSKGVRVEVTVKGQKDDLLSIQTVGWNDQKFLYFDFEEKGAEWKWINTCYFPSRESSLRPEDIKLEDADARGVLVTLDEALKKKDFNLLTKYKDVKGLAHWGPCEGDDPGEDLSMREMFSRFRERSADKILKMTAIEIEDTALSIETIRWSDQPFLYFLFEKTRTGWQWTGVCHEPIRDYGFRPTD